MQFVNFIRNTIFSLITRNSNMSNDIFFRILIGAGLLGLSGYALKKSGDTKVRQNPFSTEDLGKKSATELIASLPSVIAFKKRPKIKVLEIDNHSDNETFERYLYGLAVHLFEEWLKSQKKNVSADARNEYVNHMVSILFPSDDKAYFRYFHKNLVKYIRPGAHFTVQGVVHKVVDPDTVLAHNTLTELMPMVLARFLDRLNFLTRIGDYKTVALPFASNALQIDDLRENKIMQDTWEDVSVIVAEERVKAGYNYKNLFKSLKATADRREAEAKAIGEEYKKAYKLQKQTQEYYKAIQEEEFEEEEDEPLSTFSQSLSKKMTNSISNRVSEQDRFRHQKVMEALERHKYKK